VFVDKFRRMTWRKREELSWKSIGEAKMPRGGCRIDRTEKKNLELEVRINPP